MEYEYGLMTKADKYLVESIYNILQNGIKDENPRPKYGKIHGRSDAGRDRQSESVVG